MSLINQALIDLEKRNAESNNESCFKASSLDTDYKIDHRATLGKKRLLLLSCLPALTVFFLGFSLAKDYMVEEHTVLDQSQIVTIPSKEITLPYEDKRDDIEWDNSVTTKVEKLNYGAEIIYGDEVNAQNTGLKRQIILKPINVEPKSSLDVGVNLFEQKFLMALSDYRLATPLNDSAYYYYNKIKNLDKRYPKLKLYHKEIIEKYFVLIEQALSKEKFQEADQYRSRLNAVSEGVNVDRRLTLLFQNHKSKLPEKEFLQLHSTEIAQARSGATGISISENYSQQAVLDKVESLLAKGELKEVLYTLESEVIKLRPDVVLLSNKLIDTYISLSRYSEAKQEIVRRENSASLQVEHNAILKFFQALIIKNTLGDDQAYSFLDALEKRDLRSETLYAAYLQKHNRQGEAIESYKGLIRLEPRNVKHWLGLAISTDKVGDLPSALKAYSTVKTMGGLSHSVQQFVDDRIVFLKSNNSKANHMELSQW